MAALSQLRRIEIVCRGASPSSAVDLDELAADLKAHRDHWPELISTSSKYLLTPSLAFGLAEKNLAHLAPLDVQEYLEAVLTLNRQRSNEIRAQALELAAALGKEGLFPLFLKGSANLLAGLYEDNGQRLIGDIDILIPPGQMENTVEAIKRCGYIEVDGSVHPPYMYHWPVMYKKDRVTVVEPHFRLHALRGDDMLSPAEVVARSEFIEVEGIRVRIPTAMDRICHNIIHGLSKHSPFEDGFLYQMYDLSLLLDRYGDKETLDELSRLFVSSKSRYLDICGKFLAKLFRVGAENLANDGYYARMNWALFKLQLDYPAVKAMLFLADTSFCELRKMKESPAATLAMARKVFKASAYGNFIRMFRGRIR
ncbi:MAG: nucleotidyltransferase family protein [Nitrospinota bacterium]|nr:nucleotidyltransferase family protein [Nitrospinota bacterium]